ncbi:MAG: Sensor protein SrrB [Verrucomicrobia subdivision 3 bacterium]|nr:Sensor protein SrrB [Limisphaerales bacterium]MCS1415319.1 Sensor protein SrrB [Limisphaerales bacterium]
MAGADRKASRYGYWKYGDDRLWLWKWLVMLVGVILSFPLFLNALILATGVFLVQVTRRRRQLAAEQMRFVATVSHELRTPLAVISGAAHNLKTGIVKHPDRVRRYAGLIDKHVQELSELVEHVLAFARRGGTTAAPSQGERLPLYAVLDAAVESSGREVEQAGCTLEWMSHPSLSEIFVVGDAAALTRAFCNLVINAAKHGASGGWIGISVRQEEVGDSQRVFRVDIAARGQVADRVVGLRTGGGRLSCQTF